MGSLISPRSHAEASEFVRWYTASGATGEGNQRLPLLSFPVPLEGGLVTRVSSPGQLAARRQLLPD